MIAFESPEKMDQLIRQAEANHREYIIGHQNYPSLQLKEKSKDIDELEKKQKRALERINVADLEFFLEFEGVYIRMMTDENKIFSEAVLEGVVFYYILKPMDFMVQAQLKNCSIFDYSRSSILPNGEKQDQSNVLFTSKSEIPNESEAGRVWINVIFKGYGDNHPYFQKTRTKSEVDIRFSLIRFEWRQELLNLLIAFCIQKNVNFQDQKTQSDKQAQIQIPNELNQSVATTATEPEVDFDTKKFRKKSEGVDIIFMRLSFVFEEFSLLLLTPKNYHKLASFHVKKLNINMVNDNLKMLVEGSMEDMKLLDLTNYQQKEDNVNPFELIGLYGGQNSFLEFQFFMYKEPKFITNEVRCKIEINLNINKVNINWIHQPFMRLINFVTKNVTSLLNTQQINAPPKVDTYDIESQNHESMSQKQALIKKIHQPSVVQINVTVNHPRLVIKPKVYSKFSFEFDFGMIKVSNKFHLNIDRLLLKMPNIEYLHCQIYHLETSGISFSKVIMKEDSIQKNFISKDFNIDIVIDMILNYDDYVNLSNVSNKKEIKYFIDNAIKIEGRANQFLFNLNQEDYSDLMDVIFGNILYDDHRNDIFNEVAQPKQTVMRNENVDTNPLASKIS